MPKIKMPKSSPSIDMTPMVDLAFLLVTFFMLAASFRSSEPVQVTTPTSVSDKIIIYRDGVGEGMRDMIITNEISQFKETLKGHFNSANIPKITLIVVNKRINQRIFVKKGDEMQNPEPGTIIDSVLVENNESNKCYDFFLVPQ